MHGSYFTTCPWKRHRGDFFLHKRTHSLMDANEKARPEIETEFSELRITPQSSRIEGTHKRGTKAGSFAKATVSNFQVEYQPKLSHTRSPFPILHRSILMEPSLHRPGNIA